MPTSVLVIVLDPACPPSCSALFPSLPSSKYRLLPDTEIVPSWRRFSQQNKNFEALIEKLTVVEVDMTSAKLNTDVLASYPAGFYRKNCVIIGISVYDRVNNNYYSLFGDTTVTAMLGSKVIVKTSQSNYIGAGSKIRVVLYKIA